MATQFSAKTGNSPTSVATPLQIEQPLGDALETALAAAAGDIWEIASEAEFRTSEKLQTKLLNAVETGARHLTDTVINYAAKSLESPLEQESRDMKRQAIAFFKREISQHQSKRDACKEAVSHEQNKIDAVVEMKSRCDQNRGRHHSYIRTTIENEHHTNT
jgi:hypothetical protein